MGAEVAREGERGLATLRLGGERRRRTLCTNEGQEQVAHGTLGVRQVDQLAAMHDPQMPAPVLSAARFCDPILKLGDAHV